jgi:glycosyltransferase involved in cell wall biosynthesis
METHRHPVISVVTPVYGCRGCLVQLYSRLRKTLEQISPNFEIVMVDDASPDNSWTTIEEICAGDPRVKGIRLSRNFGQHKAITAGLDQVKGEWTVVMDCDLQDQPEEILKLYARASEGFDVVFGRRVDRQDGFLKRISSRFFTAFMSMLMDQRLDPTTANFGIYRKAVIEGFKRIHDADRSFPVFVRWLGFRRTTVDIEHAERAEGRSSYTLMKLISFAVTNVTSYSNKPLILSTYLGLIMSGGSIFTAICFVVRYLRYGVGVEGWTSLMVSLYFLFGLLLANLGVLGLYVGKAFDQAKGRPLYIIQKSVNMDEQSATSAQRV